MVAIPIEANLSSRQFSKFKSLFVQMKLVSGRVYFPTNEMHGVLLTNSRQGATNIVKAHLRYLQPYIENIDDKQHIKHIGVDVLLDKLGEGNPGKKTLYLAASAYIAAQLANDPAIYKDAQLRADEQDKKKTQVMQLIKKQAKYCALSRVEFGKGIECCVHHIEGLSEQPELATDVKNLIPLTRAVHEKYHSWVIAEKLAVTRATLKQFALVHNYSRNWSTAQQLELFTAP